MRTFTPPLLLAVTLVCLTAAIPLHAQTPPAAPAWELPSILGPGMVLQRATDAPVWGWDAPGTTVTVSFRGATRTAIADADGKWIVTIPSGEAGGPFELAIRGSREAVLTDVLVGEVWMAGGQSNMWWPQRVCQSAEQERVDGDLPLVRYWDANTSSNQSGWRAETPQRTVAAKWQAAAPAVVGDFAGVPFFFARELHRALRVPVGIVQTAVPGTPIAPFLSPEFVRGHAGLEYGDKVVPSALYNGMLAPVVPFAVRGVLWWQGESDAARFVPYRTLFPGLIADWRRQWGQPDLPFLFVELASFLAPQTRPVEDDSWPALRDAQLAALSLKRTWEVSAIDIIGPGEEPNDIHPPNKQLIAHRLFLVAMAEVYGARTAVWSGPRLRAATFAGDRTELAFDHAHGGLTSVDGQPPRGFAVAGEDRRFVWATARIENDRVVLTSPEVVRPVAARYAWANNPVATLRNGAGLPAFPLRTDDWELCLPKPPPAAPAPVASP